MCLLFIRSAAPVSASCLPQDFQDFNKDTLGSDLVWRNKYTFKNQLWFMNGLTYIGGSTGLVDCTDIDYRIAGTGQFDANTDTNSPTKDLLWQNERTFSKSVWFMNGQNYSSSASITPDTLPEWRVVGAGAFDTNCHWDVVFQNTSNGSKAIWLMNGTNFVKTVYPTPDNNDTNWVVEAVADMGKTGIGGLPSGVRDGIPDIVFRHYGTGQQAIWFMGRPNAQDQIPCVGWVIKDVSGNPIVQADKDWSIVGSGDYNGDSKTDLLFRRADIGLTVVWYMDGNKYLGNDYIDPSDSSARRVMYGNAWKMATQKTGDTSNRLDQCTLATRSVAWGTDSSDSQTLKITLTWTCDPLHGSQKFQVERKQITDPDTSYAIIAQNLTSFTYTDPTVQTNQLYKYRVQAVAFGDYGYPMFSTAGVKMAPLIINRGRVILLVDSTLSSDLATNIATLKDDLVGDGWQVLKHDVARHVDTATSGDDFRITNGAHIAAIKSTIRTDYDQDTVNTKAILIVGHVAVPYSGDTADDGHPDHYGTWAADSYYGDINGTWNDSLLRTLGAPTNNPSLSYLENWNYPTDTKWDNDAIPNLKLAVGRMDFSRLTSFGGVPETALIQRYLAKNHKFRHKLAPYPLPERAISYGSFNAGLTPQYVDNDNIYRNSCGNSRWLLGHQPNSLVVGDPYFQLTRGFLWGFLSGSGGTTAINTYDSFPIFIEHTTGQLVDPAYQPQIGFHLILGSYMADWHETNNFMRATLATIDYNLAIMWVRNQPDWDFTPMTQGGTLGDSLLTTLNRQKYMTILGDATLRLQAVAPLPSDPTWTSLTKVLSWSRSPDDSPFNSTDVYYIVEYALNKDSPWSVLTTTSGTSVTDSNGTGTRTYRVRAQKLSFTGSGSYYNFSQGRFKDVTN